MNRLTAVCLALCLACAAPRQRPEAVAVLLAAPPTTAERSHACDAFDQWIARGVRTPGATFQLLLAGRDRGSGRVLFATEIPSAWAAPNAVANREHFVSAARRRFAQALAVPATTADSVRAPTPRLVTLPELDSRGVRWAWAPPTTRVHRAIICDLSVSAAGVSCTDGSLHNSYDTWAQGGLATGSTLRIWIVGSSVSTTARVFAVETPELPLAERAAYLLGARRELEAVLVRSSRHAGSAVAEALTVAVTDLASHNGTKELHVLSDLRQTSGPWTFDRRVPPAREFVRWLAAERLLPNCSGITVTLCGLHFGATPKYPPFTARQGALVRDVWTYALAAMHGNVIAMCSECDATTFQIAGGQHMASRTLQQATKHAAQIGTNRGGRAFVAAAPADTADVVREWTLLDAKPGRAAALATTVQKRFPSIHTVARQADGRNALVGLDPHAVVIGTVDTVDATRALVTTRQPQQTLCFQLVGRGPGPAVTATRLGLAGIVQTEAAARDAGLLLEGFATITEAASSRALTAAGDPMSAALLHPMRLATTKVTARYFHDALHDEAPAAPALTFFTASDAYPLIVRRSADRAFSVQRASALDAVEHLQTHRVGTIAAVALVDLDERAIDVFFITRSRDDRRRVDGVVTFRAPAQRFTAPAVFTD
jgi:hypothetical protein